MTLAPRREVERVLLSNAAPRAGNYHDFAVQSLFFLTFHRRLLSLEAPMIFTAYGVPGQRTQIRTCSAGYPLSCHRILTY